MEKYGIVATNETLISIYADPDPLFGPIAVWEIGRRLQKVKSTRLATRFFLPRDKTDHADAFDGLVATCWRSKGNLYIRPTETMYRPDESVYAATRTFIIITVLEILAEHRKKSPIEILTAALSDEFRHIPGEVKNKMKDEIRRWTAAKRHAVLLQLGFVIGKDEEGEEVKSGDVMEARLDASSVLGQVAPPAWHYTPEELSALIQADRDGWVDLVGDAGWEVIFTVVDLYEQGAADGAERDWEKLMTQEIARRRGVSLEQARADRRKVQDTLRRTVRHPLMEKLRELFVPDEDMERADRERDIKPGSRWDNPDRMEKLRELFEPGSRWDNPDLTEELQGEEMADEQ